MQRLGFLVRRESSRHKQRLEMPDLVASPAISLVSIRMLILREPPEHEFRMMMDDPSCITDHSEFTDCVLCLASLDPAGTLVVKECVGGSSAEECAQIEAGDILTQVRREQHHHGPAGFFG
jgi:hypothetical protein